jgi:hypothetical protein
MSNLKKFLVNLLCYFIPVKDIRHSIRRYFRHTAYTEYKKLLGALADPNGAGMIEAIMYYANIPEKYKHVFYKIRNGSVCLDCGANVGMISDLFYGLAASVMHLNRNRMQSIY